MFKTLPLISETHFGISGNKIHFISLGCPRNLVDTEVMLGILLKSGYEVTQNIQHADFIVINTCGFLEASRQESLDTIQMTLNSKKNNAKVIVTGCMVQKHSEQIKQEFPYIDYMLGSGDVEGILQAVQSESSGEKITTARSYLEMGEIPRQISTPQHFAYLKIAEGCRKRCAFCSIPDIKGPLKSKPKEQILKELTLLLNQGVKEVILIAQDLGDYGKDKGFKGSSGLADLLRSIMEVPRDFWLRLLYLYPDEITDEIISLMQQDNRICRYIDMPIQHVNNTILKSMRRLTTREDIASVLVRLRKQIPDIAIRTSLIVGFPGETPEQFQELCSFIQEYPIDNIGVFKYSRELGTHAATLDNQVDEKIKENRLQTLVRIQSEIVEKRNRERIGKRMKTIVEGYHPETKLLMRARYGGQCPDIDGEILINDTRKVKAFGEFYTVEITDVAGYDLVGRVIEGPHATGQPLDAAKTQKRSSLALKLAHASD